MKTTFRSFVLVTCVLLGLGIASATTVIPPTFDELVGQAEVVSGTGMGLLSLFVHDSE